jgi:hypothetical protein
LKNKKTVVIVKVLHNPACTLAQTRSFRELGLLSSPSTEEAWGRMGRSESGGDGALEGWLNKKTVVIVKVLHNPACTLAQTRSFRELGLLSSPSTDEVGEENRVERARVLTRKRVR